MTNYDVRIKSEAEMQFEIALRCLVREHATTPDVQDAIGLADGISGLAAVIAGPLARELSPRREDTTPVSLQAY